MRRRTLLTISGSLRAQSVNTALLRALALVAPAETAVILYDGLGGMPLFNPDREADANHPGPVLDFRMALQSADAVIFSTPEYAHGIPGALKNALDWIVGTGELSGKLVALLNASSRGVHAQASLKEVLATMDARLLPDAEATVDLLGKKLDPAAIAASREYASALHAFLSRLTREL